MITDVTDTNVGKMTFQEAINYYKSILFPSTTDKYILKAMEANNMAIEALEFQKELVRCRNCANALPWRGDSFYCSIYSYETWKMLVIDDGYCHLGERRDEE